MSSSGRRIAVPRAPMHGGVPLAHSNGVCARHHAAPHRGRLAIVEPILEGLAGLRDAQQRISRGAAGGGSHGREGCLTRPCFDNKEGQGKEASDALVPFRFRYVTDDLFATDGQISRVRSRQGAVGKP